MTVKISFEPVGVVHNEVAEAGRFHFENIVSRIVLEQRYSPALDGIENFSHVIIIFHFNKINMKESEILKVHPRKDPSLPLTGVFATRSPARPNLVGVSTVKLLSRNGSTITVEGLDAINGTPVLDIKPYIPEQIDPGTIRQPAWTKSNAGNNLTGPGQ